MKHKDGKKWVGVRMHKKIFYLHVIINAKQDGCESTLAGIES